MPLGIANVAQPAERLIRNEQVSGSIPLIGSIFRGVAQFGSAFGSGLKGRRFKSCHPDHVAMDYASFAYRTERFSFPSDKLTCYVIATFPQKATALLANGLQARRLYANSQPTTFLRLPPSAV